MLGAGRDRADAAVDHSVGIDIVAPIGTAVQAGEPVLVIACGAADRVFAARELLDRAIEIADTAPPVQPLVIGVVH
jgi:thymidine phosphorylase